MDDTSVKNKLQQIVEDLDEDFISEYEVAA
jgi:hypothetical protein